MNKEGMGVRSIGRFLKISASNVVRIIVLLQNLIEKPVLKASQQEYEVDELCTFIGHKANRIWIAYAYVLQSGQSFQCLFHINAPAQYGFE